MRPLEILLLVADLVAFLLLVVPLRGRARWLRHAAPVVLPVMGAQLLVEGPRWQLVPAYALAGLFFLVWLLQTGNPADRPSGRGRTSRLAAGVGVGLGVLGLAVSLALPMILPVFRFPHLTGPYAIGTVTYHWVDAARREVFTVDPHDRRELMVQLWYPAKPDPAAPRAPWVQDADAVAPALARLLFHVPEFTFEYWKYITSNAMASAPMADEEPSYPVLLFLHGFLGFRQHNTFQVEELVSHGYIVVAIDQPYAAAEVVFPDGRQVEGWESARLVPLVGPSISPVETAPILNGRAFADGLVPYFAHDASFTLDQLAVLNQADPNGILTGRLDLQREGIFGVSLGGIVGGEACRLDARLRAFVVEDAPLPADVVKAGLRQPTMWISRDAATMQLEGWSQAGPRGIDVHQTSMRVVFESLPGDGYLVLVRGMFHLNLTDYPYLSPLTSLVGVTGPIDAQRAHSIINAYSLAFFDQHLKGRPAALLDGLVEHYPEVR